MQSRLPIILSAALSAATFSACSSGEIATAETGAAALAETVDVTPDVDDEGDLIPSSPAWSCALDERGPSFDGEMLVFDDGQQFAEIYGCLAKTGDGELRIAPDAPSRLEVLHPGYQSLRRSIAEEEAGLVAQGALTPDNLPDRKVIADLTLRVLVNRESKVRIGGEIVELTPDLLGAGGCEAQAQGNGGNGQEPCSTYRTVSRQDDDGDGHILVSTAWVSNVPLPGFRFGIVGSSSRVYEAITANGQVQLVPAKAELLATGAWYSWSQGICGANPSDASYIDVDNDVAVVAHSDWWWTSLAPFFLTKQHQSSHVAVFANTSLQVDIDLFQGKPTAAKPFVSTALIQSNYGSRGNFEVVAAAQAGGIQHFYRANDVSGKPWIAGVVLASGQFNDVSLIQSNYGSQRNFEVVAARQAGGIQHFYRANDVSGKPWIAGAVFGGGPFVSVSLIQSNFGSKGNFEVVAALQGGGLQHFYRANDVSGKPWIAGAVFGSGQFSDVSLIQSNFGSKGNFEVVATRVGGGLQHFYRANDLASKPWIAGAIFGAGSFEGVSLIQSNYGSQGNFEVVATRAGGGLQHFYRANDVSSLPWIAGATFGGAPVVDVSLIQSNYGSQRNFEVVVPLMSGALQHSYRANDVGGEPWFTGVTF